MNNELHNKAWKLLEDKGLLINERIFVRSAFADTHKEDYPFILAKHKKGEVEYYYSSIEQISNLAFTNEKEVILANAIYENVKDSFNINEFIQMLKFTFRILNTQSEWK